MMCGEHTINIALSSDARGYSAHATLLASILRRTRRKVWIKYWCRDFLPENFEVGQLKVEFFNVVNERDGVYPGHVTPAVFDRLEVIREAPEWERCLVMDYDMLVTCDLGEYFDEEFEGNLLMGRLWDAKLSDAQILWRGAEFPEEWEHTKDYPYFYMGPMMNLAAMRKAGTWDKLIAAHEAFFAEEQIALTAATDGKVKGVDRKWNMLSRELSESELPEGVIHWTGWPKPWTWGAGEGVWRPEVWESERCSWDELRAGEWEKPVAWLFGRTAKEVLALAKRGWKIVAITSQRGAKKLRKSPMLDMHVIEERVSMPLARKLLEEHGQPEFVRAGNKRLIPMLHKVGVRPSFIAVGGNNDALDLKSQTERMGYSAWARVDQEGEPSGGRIAQGVDYATQIEGGVLGEKEELHARV